MKIKKHLTEQQEFEIMKLVLDKFLWIGFIVMAYGLFLSISKTISEGIYYLLAGAILLVIFIWIIIKEYEVLTD